MVAAMMGPCAAGTAYIPGLADFVPMVVGPGRRWRSPARTCQGGRPARTSRMEELGGAKVHCRKSGVGDLEVDDDEECIERDQGLPLLLPAATARSSRRCARPSDPVDRDVRGAARHRPRVQRASPTTCTR